MAGQGYRGTLQGSVQTGYADQPLAGFPGQLATLPDLCLVDGFPVNETDGIRAGLGVVRGADIDLTTGEYSNQSAPFSVQLPVAGSTAANFVGVSVRDSAMPNDNLGNPMWPDNGMSSVLREGRIFVTAPVAVDASSAVFMYIQDTTTHGNPVGSFTNAAAGADTVELTNANWYRSAPAGATDAIIEFRLRTA